jgi:CheY-like chemotaxis protein
MVVTPSLSTFNQVCWAAPSDFGSSEAGPAHRPNPGQADANSVSDQTGEGSARIVGGTERILVVEDEPHVRQFVVTQLAKLGYETHETGDGRSALALLNDNRDFDLLFTDIILPDRMSGLELAVQARKLQPGLKVLFTSGYSGEAVAKERLASETFHLLRKPYRRQELAASLRLALDSDV